jgi:hypothetical protein
MGKVNIRKLSYDDIVSQLVALERKHEMPSAEFYRRFTAGELGDGREFLRWASLYQAALAVSSKELVEV